MEETVEFSRSIWKKKAVFNRFFQNDGDKTASAARNLTNSVPQTDAKTFALPSVSILFLWLNILVDKYVISN